jgi:hypothetical protein
MREDTGSCRIYNTGQGGCTSHQPGGPPIGRNLFPMNRLWMMHLPPRLCHLGIPFRPLRVDLLSRAFRPWLTRLRH